jgi:DNA-binding transcriptional ArsR family regulator
MRSEAPALLPIFRSQHQAKMLSVLMLHPNQDFTLSDLARRLGVPASTLHLETQRMIDAGLLTSRQVGRSRLLRANTDNRIVGPLTDLLAATFGALPVVEEEFADIPDADMVVIFGSWAARHAGVAGMAANDVDVLVPRKSRPRCRL